MRAFPLILSVAIVSGLVGCQPAQQADTASPGAGGTASDAAAPSGAATPDTHGDEAVVAAAADAAPAFRATGNEPGWLAQVSAGSNPVLRVETGFGEQQYEIASPTQGADGWSGKAADGTEIKLTYQRTVCQDTMSGQTFTATAMLTVGARQYHGCGNFAGDPVPANRP